MPSARNISVQKPTNEESCIKSEPISRNGEGQATPGKGVKVRKLSNKKKVLARKLMFRW